MLKLIQRRQFHAYQGRAWLRLAMLVIERRAMVRCLIVGEVMGCVVEEADRPYLIIIVTRSFGGSFHGTG